MNNTTQIDSRTIKRILAEFGIRAQVETAKYTAEIPITYYQKVILENGKQIAICPFLNEILFLNWEEGYQSYTPATFEDDFRAFIKQNLI